MELFPSIISRAKTLQVVHSEVPGHATGSIHLVINYCMEEYLLDISKSKFN